ncbi:hypothetical protein GALMADRAFT_266488 [Galerina marginata CBS 339.88]|uniref:Uncharacterized protein n=1 Tax=Galerina marginata (strain CBS 339.88) TaxID=685588 RepID=A0A067T448_GALM3|nr:hypothetical protein GALMADRAFT_266488 [Galerina marginata CBS 339.88]
MVYARRTNLPRRSTALCAGLARSTSPFRLKCFKAKTTCISCSGIFLLLPALMFFSPFNMWAWGIGRSGVQSDLCYICGAFQFVLSLWLMYHGKPLLSMVLTVSYSYWIFDIDAVHGMPIPYEVVLTLVAIMFSLSIFAYMVGLPLVPHACFLGAAYMALAAYSKAKFPYNCAEGVTLIRQVIRHITLAISCYVGVSELLVFNGWKALWTLRSSQARI